MGRPRITSSWLVAVLAALALAAPAQANNVSIGVPPVPPPEDAAFPLRFSGTNTEGETIRVVGKVRRAGGADCAPLSSDDPGDEVLDESVGPGTFGVDRTYTPDAPGEYLICAWLEERFDDRALAPAVRRTVAVRAPDLRTATTVSRDRVRPGRSFAVRVTYTAEVPRYLTVVFAKASACSISARALRGASAFSESLVGSDVVSGTGTADAAGTAPESVGRYVVCAFLEEDPYGSTAVAQHVGAPVAVTVAVPARARRCGRVGGPRRIRDVRALRVSCGKGRRVARRWGQGRARYRTILGMRCRPSGARVTCSAGSRRVTFRFRRG